MRDCKLRVGKLILGEMLYLCENATIKYSSTPIAMPMMLWYLQSNSIRHVMCNLE